MSFPYIFFSKEEEEYKKKYKRMTTIAGIIAGVVVGGIIIGIIELKEYFSKMGIVVIIFFIFFSAIAVINFVGDKTKGCFTPGKFSFPYYLFNAKGDSKVDRRKRIAVAGAVIGLILIGIGLLLSVSTSFDFGILDLNEIVVIVSDLLDSKLSLLYF